MTMYPELEALFVQREEIIREIKATPSTKYSRIWWNLRDKAIERQRKKSDIYNLHRNSDWDTIERYEKLFKYTCKRYKNASDTYNKLSNKFNNINYKIQLKVKEILS